jgi:hypothetical protein
MSESTKFMLSAAIVLAVVAYPMAKLVNFTTEILQRI